MVLHALHLCSGYGGFELALRLAGIPTRTVAHVERDAYAAATLVARMDETHLDQAPIWSDLTTFDTGPWVGRVDLITAGFPCQPFSAAGKQLGTDDERWLWPAIGRIIRDVGPRLVLLENVPGLVRAGLPHVLSDLAQLGFDAEWGLYSASEVGAPHRRERIWILGHANGHLPTGESGSLRATTAQQLDRKAAQPERRSTRATAGDASDQLDWRDQQRAIARPQRPRRATLPTGTQQPRPGDHIAHGAGQAVADTDGARPQGLGRATVTDGTQLAGPCVDRRTQWPPGRDDADGWRQWTAQGGPEPAVRRSPNGRPAELADSLHLGGNGLVPAVAAAALVELARRLDLDLWADDMTTVPAVKDTEQ